MTQDSKITCSKYSKQVGESKRCVHFLPGGACALPDEVMCTEWLKVNQPKAQDPPKQEKSQIFGFLGDVLPCSNSTEAAAQPSTAQRAPQAEPASPVGPSLPHGAEQASTRPQDAAWTARAYGEQRAQELRDIPLEQMSLEAVESLTNLKVETLVNTNSDMGEVWLVPEYTEQNRNELTYRDMRYLMLVVKVFPGAILKTVRRPE
jgi:hypothetical protein